MHMFFGSALFPESTVSDEEVGPSCLSAYAALTCFTLSCLAEDALIPFFVQSVVV